MNPRAVSILNVIKNVKISSFVGMILSNIFSVFFVPFFRIFSKTTGPIGYDLIVGEKTVVFSDVDFSNFSDR